MIKPSKVVGSAAAALFLVVLGGWQDSSFANLPPGIVLYSGRATVLRATVNVLTSTTKILLADTGELDSNGGTKDATVVTFDNPPPLEVHSKTAHAITSGASNVSASTAAVEKLLVNVGGALKIRADVIEADSFAECHQHTGTVSVHGTSNITNLTINGTPINVASPPNSKITIPGVATIIINEQTHPDVNTIVVNAVHITVPGVLGAVSADIVISHAESDITTCTIL